MILVRVGVGRPGDRKVLYPYGTIKVCQVRQAGASVVGDAEEFARADVDDRDEAHDAALLVLAHLRWGAGLQGVGCRLQGT